MERANNRQAFGLPQVFRLGILVTGLLLVQIRPIFAQTGTQTPGHVAVTSIDDAQFPLIEFNLDVNDASNEPILDLKPLEVQVLENGQARPITTLERQKPGLQIITAINAAPLMATAVNGTTPFLQIQSALTDWAKAQPESTQDDFSLVTNHGPESIRLTSPAKWVKTLQDYQPHLTQETAGGTSLSQALDLATDPNPRPNMKRAIAYITPPPSGTLLTAMPNITGRAVQLGVHVFVWMVTGGSATDPAAVIALQKLASNTGGQFFAFSGKETLPGLDSYLEPLRYSYHTSYTSQVSSSGEQSLSIQVQRPDFQASSPAETFNITVSPPVPIFLSPPTEIKRNWLPSAQKNGGSGLSPQTASIQIVVEFPDRHIRPLKSSRLYADDQVIAQNLQEPFDRFELPLETYTQSQSHFLKVEVEDGLGLKADSIEIPVEITVAPARLTLWQRLNTDWRIQTGAAVLLAATVIVSLLIVTGRRRWWQSLKPPKIKIPVRPSVKAKKVSTAPPERSSPQRSSLNQPSIPWPRTLTLQDAPARLVALTETGHSNPAGTVLINQKEVTFGSDPDRAAQVLVLPSVAPLHARISLTPEGEYILSDCGSIAGTWVNYCPVPVDGMQLEQGDLVNIGRMVYRFELKTPKAVREIRVSPYTDDEP